MVPLLYYILSNLVQFWLVHRKEISIEKFSKEQIKTEPIGTLVMTWTTTRKFTWNTGHDIADCTFPRTKVGLTRNKFKERSTPIVRQWILPQNPKNATKWVRFFDIFHLTSFISIKIQAHGFEEDLVYRSDYGRSLRRPFSRAHGHTESTTWHPNLVRMGRCRVVRIWS